VPRQFVDDIGLFGKASEESGPRLPRRTFVDDVGLLGKKSTVGPPDSPIPEIVGIEAVFLPPTEAQMAESKRIFEQRQQAIERSREQAALFAEQEPRAFLEHQVALQTPSGQERFIEGLFEGPGGPLAALGRAAQFAILPTAAPAVRAMRSARASRVVQATDAAEVASKAAATLGDEAVRSVLPGPSRAVLAADDLRAATFEARLLKQARAEAGPSLIQVVKENGGIKPSLAFSKEVQKEIQIRTPGIVRKDAPMALDEMAEFLKRERPQFGIETAAELEEALRGRLAPDRRAMRVIMGAEDPPPRAGNINLERLGTIDDIKRAIAEVADRNKGTLDEARRGTITHVETARLADELGLTPEKLLRRKEGKAFNAEELLASRQILVQSAEDVWRMAQAARGGGEAATIDLLHAYQRHLTIQKQVGGATAEAGRALSAQRIAAMSEPARARALTSIIQSLGDDVTEEIIKRLAALDPTSPTFIRDVNVFVAQSAKVTTADKVFEVWVNAILSGPQTHGVNSVSNTLTALSRPLLERPTAATLDFFRSKMTGTPRERFFGEAAADIFGMTRGLREGVRRGLEAFQTELPSFGPTKLEIPSRARQAIKGPLGRAVRLPGRFLVAADEMFKAVNFQGELHALAFRQAAREGLKGRARASRIAEILRNPADELIEKATTEALYRTFQMELGPVGKSFQRLRSDIPGSRYIAPFLRTPVNIAKFGLERTPLNFLRLAAKAKRGGLAGVALMDELAKPVMGSLVAAGVATLVSEGLITGGGPRDPARRQALRATGWQPYSVRIGDQWVGYGRLEPLGIVVGLTADYVELFDMTEQEDAVSKISLAIAQNLTNKTFMRGVSDMLNAASDPERYGDRWIRGLAGTVIPTGVAQGARAMDPTMRRPETIGQAIQSRVPVLSGGVPPIRDLWGRPVLSPETGAERFLSPVRRSPVIDDKASREIVRLDIRVGTPRRQLGRIDLTPEEYERYAERAGALARRMVVGFVEAPGYDRLLDPVREQRIKDLFNKARAAARAASRGEALPRILREEGREGLIRALSPLDLGQ